METVVAIDGGDEVLFEDIAVSNTSSDQKEVANPIVYKLVRVEGDGRLVPATDDEVMEVEDLLEDDKNDMQFVADADLIAGCSVICDVLSEETTLNSSIGLAESEDPKADGKKSNAPHDTTLDMRKSDIQPEEIATLSASSLKDSHIGQSRDKECLQPPCALIESVASTSTLCTSLKPDFSKLNGEICLDNLSVKELHETFKATFGRETSVKDKQWLKRRISMGLSNSCDVSTTTFVIRDNRVVKKWKAESFKNTVVTVVEEPLVRVMNDDHGDIPVSLGEQVGNHINTCGKREEITDLEKQVDNEELHESQRAAKRVRKPTKRYIEEVSEFDSREFIGKLLSPVTKSGHGQLSPRGHVRPVQNVQSASRPLVTRHDSLGGSGVEVPYVSRIRRGRPRENYMSLMKLQPSGMGMPAKLVKKSLAECDERSDYEVGNKVFKVRLSAGCVQKPLINEPEKDELYLERKTTEPETDMDSSGDNSDGNVATVPTSKGGLRRKHHRPWSLSEVVKLVEGVARYGAGRWSEIKKISFASYSYRTSVDLKDKWRNLIRASFAQLPAEKGVQNSRKHGSMPIPSPILLRVRELAEMQSQVAPELNSIKFVGLGHSGRNNVHESQPGYL